MQTPWGSIDVADAHIHFFSHRFFELLAVQKPGLTVEQVDVLTGWRMPPEDPARLAAIWAAELDRHGVAQAALIASIPGDAGSVNAAVDTYPDRFTGFEMFNPFKQTEPVLRVACLFPAMHGYSLHHPEVVEFVERMATRPSPVLFVHTGILSVGIRKKLGIPSPFDLRYSNPVDVHSLALRFPQIRFILPHFGAGFFREALMVADMCPNVYLDTSSSNSWLKYEGDTIAGAMRRAIQVIGPERLLFGTDSSYFPRGWNRTIFDQQVTALSEIGISAGDARAVFGQNFRELTGM